jgi:methyltransferase-like protein/SAM-dependent methyltransferase
MTSGDDIFSYDAMPYVREAFAQTHPARIGAIATLFGMDPAPIEACRVLEIGCASGDNLMPMAVAHPGSQFVGIDLSKRQVEIGLEDASKLAIDNLELIHADLMSLGEEIGEFDYILCHGVYSWVPPVVQQRILDLCRMRLAPQGVAFVSYNTLPGWYMRGLVRGAMRFHGERFDDPRQRTAEARRFIEFLEKAIPEKDSAYGKNLRDQIDFLGDQADSYVFHDFLEDVNEPIEFREFVRRARKAGLGYISEAILARGWVGHLPEPVREALEGVTRDPIELQQYSDYLFNRGFRQSLLCRGDVELSPEPLASRLARLWIDSGLEPDAAEREWSGDGVVEFRAAGSERFLSTGDPFSKAALVSLRSVWPGSMRFPELFFSSCERLGVSPGDDRDRVVEVAEHLGGVLLRGHLSELVGLRNGPIHVGDALEERPRGCAFARLQARTRDRVTNRRHAPVELSEASRWIFLRLDGTRDRASLLAEMAAAVDSGEFALPKAEAETHATASVSERLARTLDADLLRLSRTALLVP